MKPFSKLSPFRTGSDLAAIYQVLARSGSKPLKPIIISKKSKVSSPTTMRMLAAMKNRFHNASMRRLGVALARKKDGVLLVHVRPEKTATRPPRGKNKKTKAKKKSIRQPCPKVSPAVPTENLVPVGESAPQ